MKYVIPKICFVALLLNLFCVSQLMPGESQQGCFPDDPNNERFAAFAQQVGFLNASILSDYDPSNKDVVTVGLSLRGAQRRSNPAPTK